MTALVGVRCDCCGQQHTDTVWGTPGAGVVRRYLKKTYGWHSRHSKRYRRTVDICGSCWDRGNRIKEKD